MELMIGIALFSIALFGIMLLLSQSLALGKFSNNRIVAVNEARRVIEDIRHTADTNGLTGVSATFPNGWAQNLSTLPSGTATLTYLQNSVDPLPIRVTVNWAEKGKSAAYSVETLVTKR